MRLVLTLLFAIAMIVPMTVRSDAKKGPKHQMCVGTTLDNKKVSFKCKASEKCCFDALAAKGVCVAASATCL